MAETVEKQHLAMKLIAGLREKLHKNQDNEKEKNETSLSVSAFPTPKDVAAIFSNLQDKWEDEEAEKSILYQFIDEWVASHTKKD